MGFKVESGLSAYIYDLRLGVLDPRMINLVLGTPRKGART